jgi:hypothetical protein
MVNGWVNDAIRRAIYYAEIPCEMGGDAKPMYTARSAGPRAMSLIAGWRGDSFHPVNAVISTVEKSVRIS